MLQIRLFRWLLVAFGNLRTQRITWARLFFYSACYITQSLPFFDCLFIYVPEKCLQLPYISLSFQGNNLDMRYWARYIALCSIYFICQKRSHRFLLIFRSYWGYGPHWNYEIKMGVTGIVQEKGAFISLSSLVWGKSHVRANDAKIVRSRDAQCNTKELP